MGEAMVAAVTSVVPTITMAVAAAIVSLTTFLVVEVTTLLAEVIITTEVEAAPLVMEDHLVAEAAHLVAAHLVVHQEVAAEAAVQVVAQVAVEINQTKLSESYFNTSPGKV